MYLVSFKLDDVFLADFPQKQQASNRELSSPATRADLNLAIVSRDVKGIFLGEFSWESSWELVKDGTRKPNPSSPSSSTHKNSARELGLRSCWDNAIKGAECLSILRTTFPLSMPAKLPLFVVHVCDPVNKLNAKPGLQIRVRAHLIRQMNWNHSQMVLALLTGTTKLQILRCVCNL